MENMEDFISLNHSFDLEPSMVQLVMVWLHLFLYQNRNVTLLETKYKKTKKIYVALVENFPWTKRKWVKHMKITNDLKMKYLQIIAYVYQNHDSNFLTWNVNPNNLSTSPDL